MSAAQRVTSAAMAVVMVAGGALSGAGVGSAAPTGSQPGSDNRSARSAECDLSGDRRNGDDCVTHRALGRASDGVVNAGDRLRVRVGAYRAVRGTKLATSVQVRPINQKGTAFTGRWTTIKDLRWKAQRRDVLTARAPHKVGGYALRVATSLPLAAAASARQVSATATGMTATSAPTALSAESNGCPIGIDDLEIIEYFNQIEFEMLFDIAITDGDAVNPEPKPPAGTFTLDLSCPPQTQDFPPSDFLVTMTTADGSQSMTCNTGTIVLEKSQMATDESCEQEQGTPVCEFTVVASNKTTEAVFSTTHIMITFTDGNNTYVPDLAPATTPECPSAINPCVLTGTCGSDSN